MLKRILALAIAAVLALGISSAALSEGGFPPVPKDEIKVGFIYIGDASDGGYTYAHDQGAKMMQIAVGLGDGQIIYKTNISEDSACETAIRELVEAGCHVIFANSWGFMDYMEAMAEEFPSVIFSHCSGYKSNGTNFNNYFGRIYQARYLSGLAAGLKTRTNKIGFVAAQDNPEVNGGIDAFALGVRAANPDAEVYVKYTNTWYDPTLERQAAEALLDLDCDVIAQHQDTTMPQVAAQERGVWGVGYNADMTEAAPEAHLTAPIWHWGVYYTTAVIEVIAGEWAPINYFDGLPEGLVDLSPLSKNVADGTAEIIAEYRAKIMDGSFDVFDGEIKDNQGNVRVEAGARLTDAEITSIDWLVEGVTVP